MSSKISRWIYKMQQNMEIRIIIWNLWVHTIWIYFMSNIYNLNCVNLFINLQLGEVLLEFTIAVGARILGYLVGIGLTAVFAAIIDSAADLTMPWYSNVWLIFPLYWCPALVACALIVYLVDLWREKKV